MFFIKFFLTSYMMVLAPSHHKLTLQVGDCKLAAVKKYVVVIYINDWLK